MVQPIKTVVVHGATGLQGGSAARALAAVGYTVHAAVRDSHAPKAQELAQLPNVTLVIVDLENVQGLVDIYFAADAVFACTVPGVDELRQGKNMVDAASSAGVRLFVWSTLESVERLTADNLKIDVGVLDAKAKVSDYLAELGGLPYTNLYLGGFMESQASKSIVQAIGGSHRIRTCFVDFLNFPGHAEYDAAEDTIVLRYSGLQPTVRCSLLWVERDLPAALQIILQHPDEFVGKSIALVDVKMTCNDMAAVVQRVSGRKSQAGFDPTYNEHIPEYTALKSLWNSPGFEHFKGWPSPSPLLEKYGYQPASFEDFTKERLLPPSVCRYLAVL